MTLSIIIPVYNESKNVEKTVNNLKKIKKDIKKFNLIFIDDFSDDNTFDILNKLSKKYSFVKIFKNKKKGLGSAIEEGIKKSNFDYIAIFMADSSDSIADLIKYYKIDKERTSVLYQGVPLFTKKSPLKRGLYCN